MPLFALAAVISTLWLLPSRCSLFGALYQVTSSVPEVTSQVVTNSIVSSVVRLNSTLARCSVDGSFTKTNGECLRVGVTPNNRDCCCSLYISYLS